MSSDGTFMTPALQREYLNELRRQNAEMYNLTGSSAGSHRDPWANPAPNVKSRHVAPAPDPQSIDGKLRGPPKPPKTINLRKTSFWSEAPSGEPQASADFKPTEAINKQARPSKALPPIPSKPDRSVLKPAVTSSTTKQSQRPAIPAKPSSRNDRTRGLEFDSGIALTDHDDDIVVLKDASISFDRHPSDTGRMVSIPVFRFDDLNSTSDLTLAEHDRQLSPGFVAAASGTPSLPSFSISGPEVEIEKVSPRSSVSATLQRRGRRAPISAKQRHQVVNGLCCANCYEPFGRGRVITANKRRYHPIHFTCYECDVPLEHVDFYIHDPEDSLIDQHSNEEEHMEIYCHFDYHELFSPRCHVCTTPVIRDGVRALGKVFHAEHFFCALCSKTFSKGPDGGIEFVERDDLAWHAECYEEKFSESFTCRKCKRRIAAGTQVITMGTGSHFHPECFLCAHCKNSLEAGFFWSRKQEGICRSCKEIQVKQDM